MEFLILALLRGASYLLVALGFALVFGAGRVLNLSHGALYLLAAYLAFWMSGQGVASGGVLVAYGLAIAVTDTAGGLARSFLTLQLSAARTTPARWASGKSAGRCTSRAMSVSVLPSAE